jgi:hypothetical protein
MKKANLFSIAAFFLATLVFASCKKDPIIPNEEELITTIRYTLTPSTGGTPVVLSWTDLDGDGGGNPVVVGGTLQASTTYSGNLEVLNESVSPAEDITEEIMDESDVHQFFFQTTGGLDMAISYADTDGNGYPIGLKTSINTGNAPSSGSLRITLRHEPDKSAQGVADGNITNAGGETDVEADFGISIQ